MFIAPWKQSIRCPLQVETVWQEYGSNLKAFLKSKIADPDDVEDLFQEVLIKTHKNIGGLRSTEKLKPWLFTLARNTVIDFYRKRGRDNAISEEDLWYGDEEEPTLHQFSGCILPFINALPLETSDLLKAIDIEGQSQKGHAADLGISYSTLKSRVQRGRTQLRDLFEDRCHMDLDEHGNVVDCRAKSDKCTEC